MRGNARTESRSEMTLQEAIRALFEEFYLDEHIEMVIDEAKYDETWPGLSSQHPRVQRFREVCKILRTAMTTSEATR